jgi:hypothetical protein
MQFYSPQHISISMFHFPIHKEVIKIQEFSWDVVGSSILQVEVNDLKNQTLDILRNKFFPYDWYAQT